MTLTCGAEDAFAAVWLHVKRGPRVFFVPCRSVNLVGVHGGSSEGRMGHEPAEARCERHQLGPAELRETALITR